MFFKMLLICFHPLMTKHPKGNHRNEKDFLFFIQVTRKMPNNMVYIFPSSFSESS